MATTDPKRAALVRALMERDLYEMLSVTPDADEAQLRAGVETRRVWVEDTPMRAAARDAEMHWLAWAERALINDPDIRAAYDEALARQAAAAARAVESRRRVRRLHQHRDELVRREAERVVPVTIDPPKKAPAPRRTKAIEVPTGAGPDIEAVVEVVEVETTPDAIRVADVVDTVAEITTEDRGDVTEVEAVEAVEVAAMPDAALVADVVDTVAEITTEDRGDVTEVVEATAVEVADYTCRLPPTRSRPPRTR
ncbi:MAG: hypothetical protein EXQ74_01195 [Thermoleophilia bacterium]|nr:hypothetical protein [Thermoleophilia bacterium]